MKALLLFCMLSTTAFAQSYPHPMELQEVIKNSEIIGKTIVQNCDNTKVNEICELELKKTLSIYEGTNVLIIKSGMPMMHEYSHLRVYVQVDKDNKIERAGL